MLTDADCKNLGAPLASIKIAAITNASIAACGGSSLGFLIDPYACRYDPTRDVTVLCTGA